MERPSKQVMLINVAFAVAERSTCDRLHVGAVLARDGRILSTGYNGAPAGLPHCVHDTHNPCDESVHAEANALIFAARHGVSTVESDLFLTHSPCLGCSGLIVNAGVRSVEYACLYRNILGVQRLEAAGVLVKGPTGGP